MCVHGEGAVSSYNRHTRDIPIIPLSVPMAATQWALIAPTAPIAAKDPDQDRVLELIVHGLLQLTAILNLPQLS